MNRELVGRIAARSFPSDVRAERGGELVGTLLDAGDESLTAFGSQLVSVLRAGLASRARHALSQPSAQIAGSALGWAGVMLVVRGLIALLGFEVRAAGHVTFPDGAFLTWVLPTLVVLSFSFKRTRMSGVLGVALIVSRVTEFPARLPEAILITLLLPLAGFALMVVTPRRKLWQDSWVWLVPTAVFAFFQVTQIGLYSGIDVIVPLVVALSFLPFQPAFAIGTGLAWSVPVIVSMLTMGLSGTATSIVLVACGPLSVLAAGIGHRRVSQR